MSLSSRIKERLDEIGWSQSLLATRSGVSQSAISKIVLGQAEQSRKLPEIANALGVRADWLAYGRLPKLVIDSEPESGPTIQSWVPLISWVQAGAFCDSPDIYEPGDGEALIPIPRVVGPHAYALRIEGDSMVSPNTMTRSYPPSTIIYVDPDRSPVNGDKVIAKTIDGSVTFKQYRTDGGQHFLVPLNPQYPTITMGEDMHICGVVVGAYWEE